MTLFLPRKPPNFLGIKLGTRKEGDGRSSREKGSIVQRREELGASDVDCLRCYYIFHIKRHIPSFLFFQSCPVPSSTIPSHSRRRRPRRVKINRCPKRMGCLLRGAQEKKAAPSPFPFRKGRPEKKASDSEIEEDDASFDGCN